MRSRLTTGLGIALVVLFLTWVSPASAKNKYKILYSFKGKTDGGGVFAGVAADAQGNLYGTTSGVGRMATALFLN